MVVCSYCKKYFKNQAGLKKHLHCCPDKLIMELKQSLAKDVLVIKDHKIIGRGIKV